MMERTEPSPLARRQERVNKLTWGTLFVVMGVLFTLHDMGRIDLSETPHELIAAHAVDGDPKTRWGSAFSDPQWLAVDLGAPASLGRVRLNWEAAYAKDYEVQTSNDGISWTTARRVNGGAGGVDEQEVGGTARYVRMMGTRRATPYGYSLWELQVFDSAGALLSQGRPVTVSSIESQSQNPFALWTRFWPLMLVAGGLPLLLAPRDDTNQVIGIALTAMGTVLQLQHLHVIPWTIEQTASVLLVVVGVVILLQSQRRRDRTDVSGPGPAGDAW
jgi:F5/8 type C domain